MTNEKKFTFDEVFKTLKKEFKFSPLNIMCDLRISQIKSINNILSRCNIQCFFFQYSQSIWNHFRKYGLYGKNIYLNNSELLLIFKFYALFH